MISSVPLGSVFLTALVGTYPPERCGIATFTKNLREALAGQGAQSFVLPVLRDQSNFDSTSASIAETDLSSYWRGADVLNEIRPDTVCIQHEFGIYGGNAGSFLLVFMRRLTQPIVTTLHTVLDAPSSTQREVLGEILAMSTHAVVMSARAKRIVSLQFPSLADRLTVIPHGVRPPRSVGRTNGNTLNFPTLLSVGLISPSKGLEYAIEALSLIRHSFPNVTLTIAGVTHPRVLASHGEQYRQSLIEQIGRLGVANHVVWRNEFIDDDALDDLIQAADVCLAPYLSVAQVVSGTLSRFLGFRKPIVATPFWHALDAVPNAAGQIVPFGDSAALATAIRSILSGHAERTAVTIDNGSNHVVTWAEAAQRYADVLRCSALPSAASAQGQHASHALTASDRDLTLEHIFRLTDDTGLLQHAIVATPNRFEGYTTDDNARALLLVSRLQHYSQAPATLLDSLATRYLSFLSHSFDHSRRRFRNVFSYDRKWADELGSEECHARALWALAGCLHSSGNTHVARAAHMLFERSCQSIRDFTSPRAKAIAAIGLSDYCAVHANDGPVNELVQHLGRSLFDLYRRNRSDDWRWFEDHLTYFNARLPHALVVVGRCTSNSSWIEAGLESFRWLNRIQRGPSGCFAPIGCNGFYRRGGLRARFDQQPIDAEATVSAALAAYAVTRDISWLHESELAFDWFLGNNDLGRSLVDVNTGGCRDGLREHGLNDNQGAESTLAFLLSLSRMKEHATQSVQTGKEL